MRLKTTKLEDFTESTNLELELQKSKSKNGNEIFNLLFVKSIFQNLPKTRFGISTNLGFSIYNNFGQKLELRYNVTHKLLQVILKAGCTNSHTSF